jgi:hydroxypyruvate isomerase
MKIHRILCLSAVIWLPQLAQAELLFTNQALGMVQATLDFCARVDARDAATFHAQETNLVRDVSNQELAGARSNSEYKQAYDLISTALNKVERGDAAETCAAGVRSDLRRRHEGEEKKR